MLSLQMLSCRAQQQREFNLVCQVIAMVMKTMMKQKRKNKQLKMLHISFSATFHPVRQGTSQPSMWSGWQSAYRILKVFQYLLTKHGQLFVCKQKLQIEHRQLQNRWNSMSNTLGVAISSFQHELKGAEPLLENSSREPGSRADAASAYEQWELAAFRITAPSLGLFSQPPGMTEIWMLTLSPPERPVNAAPSVTADQAPLMLFVPKDALNLAGMPGDFKKLSTYTNLVSSACNVSCQRLRFVQTLVIYAAFQIVIISCSSTASHHSANSNIVLQACLAQR